MLARWRSLPLIARALITTGVAFVIATCGFVAAFLFAPAVGSVSSKALYWSVAREVGGSLLLGADGCQRQKRQRWTCAITDSAGSGGATYKLVLNGDCWQATRPAGSQTFEGHMATHASGCVDFRDQLRLAIAPSEPLSRVARG